MFEIAKMMYQMTLIWRVNLERQVQMQQLGQALEPLMVDQILGGKIR